VLVMEFVTELGLDPVIEVQQPFKIELEIGRASCRERV